MALTMRAGAMILLTFSTALVTPLPIHLPKKNTIARDSLQETIADADKHGALGLMTQHRQQ